MNKVFASFVAAILSFGFVGALSAEPAAPPAQKAQAAEIPESALQQFVEAEQKVSEIRTDYQARLNQVADQPEKAQVVQQEAQQKMVQAVEDTGLAVPEYNQIAQLASADESVRKRLESMR